MFLRRVIRSTAILSKQCESSKAPAKVDDTNKGVVDEDSKKLTAVECVKDCKLVPQKKLIYEPLRAVKVAILNANLTVNSELAGMLKMNPLIKEIRMHSTKTNIRGIGLDISQINTATKAFTYMGDHQMGRALSKADIVVITADGEPTDVPNSETVFQRNAENIKHLAEVCAGLCPDSVFIIAAYPINSTVPLFSEILLKHGVLCPNRVLGSMALEEMRTRTLTAISLGLHPALVHVDVIGGGTPQTVVPVVSGVRPGGSYLRDEFSTLHKKLTSMTKEVIMSKQKPPTVSTAHALSQLVGSVAKGLCGKPHRSSSVFLRTTALHGIKYLSIPVKFGLSGVDTVLGIPVLSYVEIEALDLALAELHIDIVRGEVASRPKPVQRQLLYDDGKPDVCIPSVPARCTV